MVTLSPWWQSGRRLSPACQRQSRGKHHHESQELWAGVFQRLKWQDPLLLQDSQRYPWISSFSGIGFFPAVAFCLWIGRMCKNRSARSSGRPGSVAVSVPRKIDQRPIGFFFCLIRDKYVYWQLQWCVPIEGGVDFLSLYRLCWSAAVLR